MSLTLSNCNPDDFTAGGNVGWLYWIAAVERFYGTFWRLVCRPSAPSVF